MSARLGGGFLCLACIAMPIIIVDYLMIMSGAEGGAEITNVERARYAKSVFAAAARGWTFEVLAISLIAAASFILMTRPSRAGWALAAVGALVTMPMYPIMLGGYGEVFAQPDLNVDLFMVLRAISLIVFYVGQGLMMAGFGLVLFLELRSSDRLMPNWLYGLGVGANAIAGGIFLLLHFGLLNNFAIGGPFGLVGFAIMAVFGARLALRSDPLV